MATGSAARVSDGPDQCIEDGSGAFAAELSAPELDEGRLRARQVREIAYFTPLMMLASALNASVFTAVAWPVANRALLLAWLIYMVLLLARTFHAWYRNRNNTKQRVSARLGRKVLLWAGAQALGWAMLPALFFVGAPVHLQLVILGMMMATAYGGGMALVRVPAAITLYGATLIGATSAALLIEGGFTYNLLALMCLGYGAVGFFGVRHYGKAVHQQLTQMDEVERQREVIMLLMKDFEKGSSEWLWEIDPDGRLTNMSPGFARVTGVDVRHMIGRRLSDLYLGELCDAWIRLKKAVTARLALDEPAVPVTVKGETRWWALTALPRFDEAGTFLGYRGVGSDVTLARETETTLKEAKDAAEKANRAKSKFLAVLSHELRSPLNAVIGFSEILTQESFGPIGNQKYLDYAGEIRDSSQYLLALIDDMLDIARIESGAVELNEAEFCAENMLTGVKRLMRPIAAERGLTLSVAPAETAFRLQGDPRLVRQILINLVSNAIKFTPDEGKITMGADMAADGSVGLWVRDTGRGIGTADKARVFEPFARADEEAGETTDGIGLGLTIALHLAHAHGGELTLDSEPGRGTSARFTLPTWRVVMARQLVA